MIIDLKKYMSVTLSHIKTCIKSIADKQFDIIIINEDGILSFIPYDKAEEVFKSLENNGYIDKCTIYINKQFGDIIGTQESIDVNKQHADIHDINIFYKLYKNCIFESDKEYYSSHFNELISIRHVERIEYLKNSFNKLKMFISQSKLDLELAKLIGNILTDIGIIERLNLIYHLNYIKQNSISSLKDYQNVKKDDLIFADIIGTIVNILEKEYETFGIFDNLSSYENNLEILNVYDFDNPSSISFYAKDFESKERIMDIIEEYNEEQRNNNQDENVIQYTDLVGTMISSVSSIVNTISYILIAFVMISLIVSSIMIGIITYISVIERTKEIGILRAIGASKKDISRVFNAETIIIGFVSGLMGIIITILLNIPINIIIKNVVGISNISSLPVIGAISLIIINMLLTLIAGLIPSRVASKKDPVEALRVE